MGNPGLSIADLAVECSKLDFVTERLREQVQLPGCRARPKRLKLGEIDRCMFENVVPFLFVPSKQVLLAMVTGFSLDNGVRRFHDGDPTFTAPRHHQFNRGGLI